MTTGTELKTITLDDAPRLIESGALMHSQYLKAISFLRDEAFWKNWAVRALLALAVGHILSGIIFFFAFNWNDLSGMMKFSVVGVGIFTCLLAWIIARLDSPAGQAFGIGATVLVGVMFAVLGQVYQTPAMIHTPFVLWAVLTLPFALASRNLAHWTVWLVILTVAISTYANFGLRLAGHEMAANALNLAVAGGMIGGLIILDKGLTPRLTWARAEWFRVLLVIGAIGFAFLGFTESLWDSGNPLWVLAIAAVAGLLVYLYTSKPSLATLSLASFGIFTMAAQFGLKFFDGFGDDVGIFFLVFIWLGGLTVGLVAAFRHYITLLRSGHNAEVDADPEGMKQAISVSAFSEHLGLNETNLNEALASTTDQDQPWYMHVILGIAGFLTAILGCFFFGSLMALIIGYEDEHIYELILGVLGLVIFLIAILLRRKISSSYVQHILNTMIIIGGIMTTYGFGMELDSFDLVLLLIFVVSLIILVTVKDQILEFLAAAAMITVTGMELYHLNAPMMESLVLILSTGLGIICLSRPIGTRLYKAAGTAFLMAPAVLGIALVHVHRWEDDVSRFSNDWVALIISLIVLLGAVFYLNRATFKTGLKPPLGVLIPLVIGAAVVPLGGASALLLILTGYILGSRSLAIIGTLLQIYFLTMFYYDLSLDLLTKSIALFVSGLVFLGVWYVVQNRTESSA